MSTQNSANEKFTNNADGFDIAGGTTPRKLTVSGANVAIVGSGAAVVTFPASTTTLVGIDTTDTLTNKTLTSPKINENVVLTTVATKLNFLTSAAGTTGTTSTNIVFSTSPVLVTPSLGVASATSIATSAASPLLLTNGQLVTVALTSQTVGGATLTIPDFANVSDEFTFKTKAQTMSNKTFVAPVLGTPGSGTLTNCTGLPIAGLVASTATAIGVGSIELGAASDTTIARVSAGVISVEGATVATLSANQTFTGQEKFNNIINVNNAITAVANAATVPVTFGLSTVTNNSAATLTITMTTASAVDGQMTIVRIYDFSAVAQTLTFVNTENSTVSVPASSNGSTSLPVTVGFMFNSQTTKWRCIASA